MHKHKNSYTIQLCTYITRTHTRTHTNAHFENPILGQHTHAIHATVTHLYFTGCPLSTLFRALITTKTC